MITLIITAASVWLIFYGVKTFAAIETEMESWETMKLSQEPSASEQKAVLGAGSFYSDAQSGSIRNS